MFGLENVVRPRRGFGFRGAGVINRVEAYWNRARGGRLVPLRSEIAPAGLDTLLEHVFILERIADRLARFRVAGRAMTDLVGMEVRNMPLSAVFEPTARAGIAEAVGAMFAEPATARLDLAFETGFGRPALRGEMLLLPLRSDFGDITRALGAISLSGPVGRAPRRPGIAGCEMRSLTGYADFGPVAPRARPGTPTAETTPQGLAGRTGGARSPYLKLVVVNDRG